MPAKPSGLRKEGAVVVVVVVAAAAATTTTTAAAVAVAVFVVVVVVKAVCPSQLLVGLCCPHLSHSYFFSGAEIHRLSLFNIVPPSHLARPPPPP